MGDFDAPGVQEALVGPEILAGHQCRRQPPGGVLDIALVFKGGAEFAEDALRVAHLDLADHLAQMSRGGSLRRRQKRAQFLEIVRALLRQLRLHQRERGGVVVSQQAEDGIGLVNHGAQFNCEG